MIGPQIQNFIFSTIYQVKSIVKLEDIAQHAVHRFCLLNCFIITDIVDMRLSYPVIFISGNPSDAEPHVLSIVGIAQSFLCL